MIGSQLRSAARTLLILSARRSGGRGPSGGLLVVAPHPDDETLGCAGLIIETLARGDAVQVLVATNGSASHGSPDDPNLIARRREEHAAAMILLGVMEQKVRYAGFRDGSLAEHEVALSRVIGDLLEEARPSVVAVTSAQELHPDHATCARATQTAVAHAAHPVQVWEYPIWLWTDWPMSRRVRPIKGLSALARAVVHRHATAVPVQNRALKAQALACFQSQLGGDHGDPALPAALVDRAVHGPELFFTTPLGPPAAQPRAHR